MSRLDVAGLAKQTAWGTKKTAMDYFMPVESVDVNLNREELTKEETTGTKFPTDLEYGTRFWGVTVAGAARLASLPRVLAPFLGPSTPVTPGGGIASKKHQFNPVGKVLDPHSLLVNRTDPNPAITELFYDGIGDELTLSVEANDYVNYEGAYIFKEVDRAQPEPSATLDLSERYAFHKVQAFISINGAAEVAINLSRFELTYSNNVDTDQAVLGSRSLYKVQEGNVDADISFTTKDTLNAHFLRAVLDTNPDNVKIRLLATGAIIEAAINSAIEIIVYRTQYTEAPAGIDAGDTLDEIEISARAAYDATATKFVDVNVTNMVAAY